VIISSKKEINTPKEIKQKSYQFADFLKKLNLSSLIYPRVI
jgi:hypothetical protein